MALLQTQVVDVKLLGLDEKANPREAVPGTFTSLDNCVIYKDGRIQKRPGMAALSMVDSYGATIINARELATHNGQLLLNDGIRWHSRHPVTGAWVPRGYSAYERLDISRAYATAAECNGTDSRLEMDSAVIGRYALVVMCGGDTVDSQTETGWSIYDRTTGSILVKKNPINLQDVQCFSDGATTESFVFFGVNPVTAGPKTCAITAYVLDQATGHSTVIGTSNIITDVSWAGDRNTYELHTVGRKTGCYEALRVSANTWLIAYHQYNSDGGDHSHLVIRTATRTTGATFTVSEATEVTTFADMAARSLAWAYTSGLYAHLCWEAPNNHIYSANITIATREAGTPESFGFGYWDKVRGIAGFMIGSQPYYVLDLVHTEDGFERHLYLWRSGYGYSLLVRDAGLFTKAFTVENQSTDEVGIGIFMASDWQPSAFLMRLRVSGDDQVGSTIGAHISAGDFAGKAMTLRLASGNSGAFMPIGKLYNPASLGGSGTVNVECASIRNPLTVWATPTTTAYPTQAQPVEVGGTTVFPGAALKQFDGETVCEASFYMAPDWISPTAGNDAAAMEIGTRYYTAVAKWTDARGRIQRSAPCTPVSVTTTTHKEINVEVPYLHITERGPDYNYNAAAPSVVIEIYRTKISDSVFYLVETTTNDPNAVPTVIVDDNPDTDITSNEQLYTTGDTVRNWPVIGCNLVTVHQGRMFVVTSDSKARFTGYLQDGEALTFAEEFQLDTEHIPGTFTALISLDDKLLLYTETNCASLTGIGPEANGLPAYDAPMLISSMIGPSGPRACVRIPDGVVMPTRHGIQLVDRGLSFKYIGPAVETTGVSFVPGYAGACHPTLNQVRLFGSGTAKKALVFDWTLPGPPERLGQWMPWTYSVDIVAAATCGGVLYYLSHNSSVYQADSGTSDGGTAYQQSAQFTVLSPAGVNAWARIFKMRLAVNIATGCVFKAYLNPEEGNLSAAETYTLTAATPGAQHIDLKPRRGKVSSVTCWLGENAASTNAGFVLDSIAMKVGNKGGLGRLPVASRMTRSA